MLGVQQSSSQQYHEERILSRKRTRFDEMETEALVLRFLECERRCFDEWEWEQEREREEKEKEKEKRLEKQREEEREQLRLRKVEEEEMQNRKATEQQRQWHDTEECRRKEEEGMRGEDVEEENRNHAPFRPSAIAPMDSREPMQQQEHSRLQDITNKGTAFTKHTSQLGALEQQQDQFLRWKQAQMMEINKKATEARQYIEKEKNLLEKARRAAEVLPSRGARVEVGILQQQLKEAKTEISKWELKHASGMERMRKDIAALTKKNSDLQKELKAVQLEIINRNSVARVASGPKSISSPISPNNGARPPTASRQLKIDTPQKKEPRFKNEIASETISGNGRVERQYKDGTTLWIFGNGTTKEISPDGQTTLSYNNGDIKQVSPDGIVVYHFKEAQISQITYNDGLTVYRFANGQVEKHFPNGCKEILFPDGTVKMISF